MKILNLYAGIGGNRKLWGDEHQITAVEYNQEIAAIYKDFFPNDNVIVADAHQYLLEHYKEYDFIWSSPPCPSHSKTNNYLNSQGVIRYPDMKLYEEIIFLQHFLPKNIIWVIENVIPYYNYLIEPEIILARHAIWCNFYIDYKKFNDKTRINFINSNTIVYGYNIKKYKISGVNGKRTVLRNLVNPELGLHILNQALNIQMPDDKTLFD